jgi:glycosyltransferase involved in cell wall biosynthesis
MLRSDPSEPRDVVYVIASMITGGTQTHILQVLRFLDRKRWRPHLYCLRDKGNLIETARSLDVPTMTFGMRGGFKHPADLRGLLAMRAELRRLRPDVIHGYLLRGNFYASLAARLAGVPVLVTSKRGLHEPSGFAEKAAVSVSNRLSDVVTGNSPAVLDFTNTVESPLPAQMQMIPSGIDVELFDPSRVGDAARSLIRAELGIGNAPVVGTAITFRPRKGFKLLFESFADSLDAAPDAHLVIAGAVEMPEDPAALAAKLGITDRIHLLGRRADMPEVLSAFDVFVLPSESEGMSNAILEAMAMSLPVVATAVGGAPVVIEDGVSGYLVEYPDRAMLAARLRQLLGSVELRQSVGLTARPRIVAEYSAQAMLRQMERLYARLLDEKT